MNLFNSYILYITSIGSNTMLWYHCNFPLYEIFIKITNSSVLSQCIQIHLLTTLVIWIQLILKFLQLLSKLVRKVPRSDGTYYHIYKTYKQLIYPTMVYIFQGNKFQDKTSQFGRWKSPLGPGTNLFTTLYNIH